MFNQELFTKLHGPLFTNDIPDTATLVNSIHQTLLIDPNYHNTQLCKETTNFLNNFKSAGGLLP